MATAAGDVEISVAIQADATSRMKVPMLPRTVAAQRTANRRWWSGANVPDGGGEALSTASLMTIPSEGPAGTAERTPEAARIRCRRAPAPGSRMVVAMHAAGAGAAAGRGREGIFALGVAIRA